MTKYYDQTTRKDKDVDIPISISGEKFTKSDNPSYVCSYCRCKLIRLSDTEYYCNKDAISFYPNEDNMRTANKISMPRTPEENPPLVSTKVPDPNEQYLNKDNMELTGAFKTLQDRGLKITSYSETGSDGRPLKRNRWAL